MRSSCERLEKQQPLKQSILQGLLLFILCILFWSQSEEFYIYFFKSMSFISAAIVRTGRDLSLQSIPPGPFSPHSNPPLLSRAPTPRTGEGVILATFPVISSSARDLNRILKRSLTTFEMTVRAEAIENRSQPLG
ncbi:hypothetical protein A3841_15315 [Pontibacter flavimaris]|uniref:Uncharacterized protein n=1 Tax=Pontibacter flavimaris TaxID=1797110 RepID=A0A1Q5PG04_9BACT|nr:hypothetical protein A3841_15315 [Pontibacter flavimaris]